MTADRAAALGRWNAVELSSSELAVTLLPGKGCDVLELVDRASGVDVLLKSPWTPGRIPVYAPSSFEAWLETYPGGWQLILPNGGDATVEHGVEWGFHGEAALIAWRVEELEQTRAVCSAELITAPLGVRRVVSLDGAVLRIEEARDERRRRGDRGDVGSPSCARRALPRARLHDLGARAVLSRRRPRARARACRRGRLGAGRTPRSTAADPSTSR